MLTIFCQNVWDSNPCHYRNQLIRSLVSDYNADICMFQEFGTNTTRTGNSPLQNLLSDEYTEGCAAAAQKNFTPVFYKSERFDLIDSGYTLYEGLNNVDSKSISWAVLNDKENGSSFVAVSTHFWWMYDSERDFKQRLENVDQLKSVCDEIIAKYNLPIIIGGDFNNGENSVQGEEPYKKMLSLGFKDLRLIAKKSTHMYTHHDYPIQMPDDTFEKAVMPVRNLDYIFVYGNFDVTVEEFDVITTDKALTSSDHCPLVGHIVL